MSYGLHPYGGVAYAGSDVAEIPQADTQTALSVEVAFTTDALATPVWEDITADVRFWDVSRGRSRELERFQPGRATIVLSNLSRQYDSVYSAGPHFGDIRPMRRVRIRETFNGVTYPIFDGFVDRWQLDYPEVGKDATATLTATDAGKVFARTELPVSVYRKEVADDGPLLWWRLDEQSFEATERRVALNYGSAGSAGNGTYVDATYPGAPALVVNDPGGSLEQANDSVNPGTPRSGVDFPSSQVNLLARNEAGSSTTVEFWVRPEQNASVNTMLYQEASTPSTSGFQLYWFTGGGNTGRFSLTIHTDTLSTPVNSAPPGSTYHVVYRFTPSGSDILAEIFLNGSLSASGTLNDTLNTGTIIYSAIGTATSAASNWTGQMSNAAIYTSALSDDRIAAHYAAGTAPWQGDGPDGRLERILDLAEWPDSLRELDAGDPTLQSANLEGQTALEHIQKVAETEFGLLFVDRTGKVRFISRASQGTRAPGPIVYGDGAGQVGYRSIRPDDGDEVIRNSATISRYNGVAQTATGATIDEFGRFQYTLDGLLHDSDSYSASYAQFIVDEYENPRRRIVELQIGPPKDGEEDLYLPAMLGPELGDSIEVRHTPSGVGDVFEQICVVEGIRHESSPGRNRTTTFTLSPELSTNTALNLLLTEGGDTLEAEDGADLEV